MAFLVCLVTFFSLIGCGLQETPDWPSISFVKANVSPGKGRIIGGDEVIPHSYPFQAGLKINGNAFCGGALISPNFVLTAAHCGIVIRTVEVVLGAHNITNTSETTQVFIPGSQVILHENYDNNIFLSDICLIRLATPAPLNENIQLAILPPLSEANTMYEERFIATAIGWGLTFDVSFPTTRDMSPVLMSVDVHIVTNEACSEYYFDPDSNTQYITNGNVCTSGYKNKGTCDGDSGSPLILNGTVIGLTSFGSNECEACTPSVYTKVNSYLDWIQVNSDVVILP